MIDIFYRRRKDGEFAFPRVEVTAVPDLERAQALIETLTDRLPAEGDDPVAAGRPSRRRWTVAQLIHDRDQALDRELAEIAARHANMLPHIVSSR